uniref:Uncharacterized protein n=1 Tax=Tanacetum cinerariifolium TaxID=118510 RepID=A0A699WVS3_TANCI|nr:hypothetical protein [Tanacetum cinerariifolium]
MEDSNSAGQRVLSSEYLRCGNSSTDAGFVPNRNSWPCCRSAVGLTDELLGHRYNVQRDDEFLWSAIAKPQPLGGHRKIQAQR